MYSVFVYILKKKIKKPNNIMVFVLPKFPNL